MSFWLPKNLLDFLKLNAFQRKAPSVEIAPSKRLLLSNRALIALVKAQQSGQIARRPEFKSEAMISGSPP